MDKKYLTEENYKKGKGFLKVIALVIILCGVLVGGSLILKGISKSKSVDSAYSEESKQSKIDNLNQQITEEKTKLETKKSELEAKGIEKKVHAKYDEGEVYDLYIITEVLDPSFSNCLFDEYKSNSLTAKYCSLKNELDDVRDTNYDFENSFNKMDSVPFYMFGAFIIIASCMIGGSIFMFAHRREIAAFTTQQVMPVAKEGIDEIAPTIGKAAGDIAKGIKEGLDSVNSNNSNNQ